VRARRVAGLHRRRAQHHGFGHIHEACVQLWGRGAGRQVAGAKTALAVNGGYGYGAMLLRTE
jgi:hypothetical protein